MSDIYSKIKNELKEDCKHDKQYLTSIFYLEELISSFFSSIFLGNKTNTINTNCSHAQ